MRAVRKNNAETQTVYIIHNSQKKINSFLKSYCHIFKDML